MYERRYLNRMLAESGDRNLRLMLNRFNSENKRLSAQVYKTRTLVNGKVGKIINSALGRGLSARELALEVRSLIRPDVPGGISYAAYRLGRTELNTAFHRASIIDNQDKPWNLGMDWRLSRSHPDEDVCDLLARRGPYDKMDVPEKPHPLCLCYVVPKTEEPDDFVTNYRNGKYDAYLMSQYGI